MDSTILIDARQGAGLTNLAARINAEHASAEAALNAGLQHALEAGRLLIEAKAQVAHGEWAGWLQDNFDGSDRTARAYMQVTKRWPEIEAKRGTSAVLSLDQATKLLAQPSVKTESKPTARQVFPFGLPELSPGKVFRACGNKADLVEITPVADHLGYYRVAHFRNLDSIDASDMVYDRRGVKYTPELLATAIHSLGFHPTTKWSSEGASSEDPWYARLPGGVPVHRYEPTTREAPTS